MSDDDDFDGGIDWEAAERELGENWTHEGASREGADAISLSRVSKMMRVLDALRYGPLTTTEINDIGGSEGTRRVRDLRRLGWEITVRKLPFSTEFLYTLIAGPASNGQPGSGEGKPAAP